MFNENERRMFPIIASFSMATNFTSSVKIVNYFNHILRSNKS